MINLTKVELLNVQVLDKRATHLKREKQRCREISINNMPYYIKSALSSVLLAKYYSVDQKNRLQIAGSTMCTFQWISTQKPAASRKTEFRSVSPSIGFSYAFRETKVVPALDCWPNTLTVMMQKDGHLGQAELTIYLHARRMHVLV